MNGQTLELWFWTAYDALVLHLREIRLTVLTWAAKHDLLEWPAPPLWMWVGLPLFAFGLGTLIGLTLPFLG